MASGARVPELHGAGAGPEWFIEHIKPVLLESPSGKSYITGWFTSNGTFAATLPRSLHPNDQPDSQAGTWRLQFEVADTPPADTELAVRVVLKAAPGGVAPTQGVLDLNIWLGSETGVTPSNANQDAQLQAALQTSDQLLQQVGISIGDIDYYGFTEDSTFPESAINVGAAFRAALPTTSGVVEDRLNLFMPSGGGGFGGRVPGPFAAHTNHSLVWAGYDGANLVYLIVHEALHHLGLLHVAGDPLGDTATGSLPGNIMDAAFAQAGTYISPQQGTVVRAHPFVR